MKINYLSDFKIDVTLTLGGVPIGIPDHDFAIEFTTIGTRKYRCERKGNVWTNCKDNGDTVLCLLDNHGLGCGTLMVRYIDYAPDVEMPDGDLRTVTPSSLDVELIMGAGDGSEVDASVATDVASAIARCDDAVNRVDELLEQSDELIAQMEQQVEEAREARNEAEEEASIASASAVQASAKAAEASDYASESMSSAQASAISESNAANSATSAANSANSAASSAASVGDVVSRAESAATSASGSASAALTSANNAESSASSAERSASSARVSSGIAETSATRAGTSSANAAASAEDAANSATEAAASASEAETVATSTAMAVATNVATTIAGGKADKVVRVDKTTDPATSFTIDANKVYDFGERVSLEISLAAYTGDDEPMWTFTFVSGATATNLGIPATWEILNGTFEIVAGFTYEFDIQGNLCAYGKFKTT